MRHRLIIAAFMLAVPVLLVSCAKEEPPPEEAAAPPPDPGWPEYSVQTAAIEYQLEEAHYHMRKGRYAAPDSFGSNTEMPMAAGYARWAFNNAQSLYYAPPQGEGKKALEIQSKCDGLILSATQANNHLTREHGATFDVPSGQAPRCRWCGHTAPKHMTRWAIQDGEKVVECPKCGARDPYPTGIVYTCPYCHDVIVGTQVSSTKCPTCGRQHAGLKKVDSATGRDVDLTSTGRRRVYRKGSDRGYEVPFGTWMKRCPTPVAIGEEGKGEPCSAYTAVTGRACPVKRVVHGEEKSLPCWVHRYQDKRLKDKETAGSAPAGGGGAAAGGMPGGGGGMPGGGMGGPPGGGMGGPPGGGMGGPPGGGMGGPPGGGGGPPGGPGGAAPGGEPAGGPPGGGGGGGEDMGGGE